MHPANLGLHHLRLTGFVYFPDYPTEAPHRATVSSSGVSSYPASSHQPAGASSPVHYPRGITSPAHGIILWGIILPGASSHRPAGTSSPVHYPRCITSPAHDIIPRGITSPEHHPPEHHPPASSHQAVHYFFYGLYFGDQVADLAYFNFALVYVAFKDAFAGAAFAKEGCHLLF